MSTKAVFGPNWLSIGRNHKFFQNVIANEGSGGHQRYSVRQKIKPKITFFFAVSILNFSMFETSFCPNVKSSLNVLHSRVDERVQQIFIVIFKLIKQTSKDYVLFTIPYSFLNKISLIVTPKKQTLYWYSLFNNVLI